MGDTLTVVQSDPEGSEENLENIFVIDEEFEGLSDERFRNTSERIGSFDLPSVAGIPVYDMVWHKFSTAFSEYATSPSGLADPIVLYEELADRIATDDVNEIRCQGVDPYYRSLLVDLADNEEVRLVLEEEPPRYPALTGLVWMTGTLGVVLLDLLISLVLNGIFGRPDDSTALVFVPHLNRFDSIEPVLRATQYEHRVVAPVTTLMWLNAKRNGQWEEATRHGAVPISRFVTPSVFLHALGLVVRVIVSEVLFGRFRRQLTESIVSEFGIEIDRTVAHACNHVYRIHFIGFPNYLLGQEMIKTTECNGVVIGSLSLRLQVITLSATERDVESYHLPHTVTIWQENLPLRGTDHIVASTVAAEYLAEESFVPSGTSIVPLGRPRIGKLVSERSESMPTSKGTIRIVAATQPFDDRIRRQFVHDVLGGASELDDATVTVKIHPNESADFYRDVVANADVPVTVCDGDLRDPLEQADLTVFINSNAGMESMALGTPIVSVNRWHPRTPIRPFISKGPIPVLKTDGELAEFFHGIDTDRLQTLRQKQDEYLNEHFVFSEDMAADIAAHIEGEQKSRRRYVQDDQ